MYVFLEVLSGGIGAGITDSIFNPLEVVKMRLQMEGQGSRPSQMYKGMIGTTRKIFAEDGILGLWVPGLLATWLRCLSYTGIRIGLYSSIKELLHGKDAVGEPSFGVKLLSGAGSGGIGSAIATPIDVVRLRMQAEAGTIRNGLLVSGLFKGNKPRYPNTFAAFRIVAKEEGVIAGLWRGTGANVSRAMLLSGTQLGTYDQVKQMVRDLGLLEEGPPLHLSAALVSGIAAQTVAMPADTLKTRVMSDISGRLYSGPLDCLVKTVRQEGIRALFKGFIPAVCRQGPVILVQMPIVEQVRKFMGLGYL